MTVLPTATYLVDGLAHKVHRRLPHTAGTQRRCQEPQAHTETRYEGVNASSTGIVAKIVGFLIALTMSAGATVFWISSCVRDLVSTNGARGRDRPAELDRFLRPRRREPHPPGAEHHLARLVDAAAPEGHTTRGDEGHLDAQRAHYAVIRGD